MSTVRLSKKHKLMILDLAVGSRTTTARWRDYIPLSTKGLVDIDRDEAKQWSAMWGVVCATVSLTERGRVLVADLDRDVSVWHDVATEHAAKEKRRCLCGCCMAAWRMRPEAA